MVTPLSLAGFASALLALAAVVAWLRRIDLPDALADVSAASVGAGLALGAAVVLFALPPRLRAPHGGRVCWRYWPARLRPHWHYGAAVAGRHLWR